VPQQPEARKLSLAALMRAARNTYVVAVRGPLAKAGFDDLPRDGVYTISAIAGGDISPAELSSLLGVSKQAVSQLLDTLVVRGYVERSIDTLDRRRMHLGLTDRGKEVATLCRRAVDRVEQRIAQIVGEERVHHTRQTLQALIALASEWKSTLAAAQVP
jgi:DNA-binding MarR family transcriptional regulator